MKVFTCVTISGHYLGGVAVVVASSPAEAQGSLAATLAEIGLAKDNEPSTLVMTELDCDKHHSLVLWDGNY